MIIMARELILVSWKSAGYVFILFSITTMVAFMRYPIRNSTKFTKPISGLHGRTDIFLPSRDSQWDAAQRVRECPGVLSRMTQGKWLPQPHTYAQKLAMLVFLARSEARYRFPANYQRKDGKCGNVTHELPVGNFGNRIRALCDPLGLTPCCDNNRCLELSEFACLCYNCTDVRHDRHAEFSIWWPTDPRCKFKTYTSAEACRLLSGSVLHLVGDSFIRHIYTALLMVLTGDFKHGALKRGVSGDILGKCSGLYMFTEKTCRHHLSYSTSWCGGTVTVLHKYYYNSGFGTNLKTETLRDLVKPRTMLVTGIATHDDHNSKTIQEKFLLPLIQEMKMWNLHWPKLLWVDQHAPGLMLTDEVLEETRNIKQKFNSDIAMFLKNWNVPILKTYNMTDGMSSFDSEHYGLGMNVAKAYLLLNYIEELQRKGEW